LVQFKKEKNGAGIKKRTRFIEKMNKEFMNSFSEEERIVYSKAYI
jgi:hypothetical protein